MSGRLLITLAGTLLCLPFALPGFAQLPAVPAIQVPERLQIPALEGIELEGAELAIPTELEIPIAEDAEPLTLNLQFASPDEAQAPVAGNAQAAAAEQVQVPAEAPTPPSPETAVAAQTEATTETPAQNQAPEQGQVPTNIEAPAPLAAQGEAPNPAPVLAPAQVPAPAQTPAAPPTLTRAATPPADLCQMTNLDAQTYPRAIVLDIQERLHRIYRTDPAWPTDEQDDAVRLADGILGSVTRSWMGRFCRDFHLERLGDVITLLPPRVVAIAVFAERYATTFAARLEERGLPETVSVLISPEFAAWVAGLRTAEQLDARNTLSSGNDADLLALVNRYLGRPVQTERADEPNTLYVLREDDLAELTIRGTPVPPEVVAMLQPLQDLEFPERAMLHRAAQNHLINNLGLCQGDLAEAADTRPALLAPDQYRELQPWLASAFPLLASLRADGELPSVSCSRFPYEDFAVAYDAAGFGDAIDAAATEKMPAYTHTPIQWNGDDCGCVPPELASTAYGIYPYWRANGMEQNFDFSIFSRVGYFGLEMGENGQLRQIMGGNSGLTLLNDTAREPLEFIKVARTFGSKVDWMIDKDWGGTQASGGALSIRLQLENLHNDIVQLLNHRPADPMEAFRPLLSLGLAPRPFNGDGVTLYFRNFPNDPEARLEFEDFFHGLKDDLRRLAEERNRLHPVDHSLYVNLVVNQQDFMDPDSIFSSASLEKLLGVEAVVRENLSVLETQEHLSSVVILLLDEPHYSSLDTIYTLTHETSRSVILPLLISDYRDMKDTPPVGGTVVDSRTKKLDYLHESFGGAAFWPMPERVTEEAARYEGFENYITRKFAPGAEDSWWTDAICPWRWPLIGIINAWLVLAFTLIAVAFFLYPMNCRRMPWALNLATRPIALAIILLPPTVVWFYLLVEDPLLTPFWYPYAATLLLLIIAALIGRALYSFMVELRRRKPARIPGYDPRRLALAGGRRTQTPQSAQTLDDDTDRYESFTAD